jgi:Glycosyltransferase family 28 C-terminal domain
MHVNTLAAFDGVPSVDWGTIVHGAPALNAERRAFSVTLPWPADDATPVVLLSFSTVAEQRDAEMLQRALDALAPLPVRVVATTGAIVDPAELSAPANAWLIPFADHDALMARATMVLGHGGHGTTMRALRYGLPIVGIPPRRRPGPHPRDHRAMGSRTRAARRRRGGADPGRSSQVTRRQARSHTTGVEKGRFLTRSPYADRLTRANTLGHTDRGNSRCESRLRIPKRLHKSPPWAHADSVCPPCEILVFSHGEKVDGVAEDGLADIYQS